MLIYVIFLIITFLLYIFKVNKKIFCTVECILFILLIGLRSIDMGLNDTKVLYIDYFNKIKDMSFVETLNFIRRIDTEYLFYILTKIFTYFSTNENLYLFIFAIPYPVLVCRAIYKYSKIPVLSIVMFFSLNYFGNAFYTMRHVIALGFVVLSLDYIIQRKPIKFVITVLVASLFHRTALIFIFAYLISKLKIGKKQIIAIFIALFIAVLFGEQLMSLVFQLISSGHFSLYNNDKYMVQGTLTTFVIYASILLFQYFLRKYDRSNEDIEETRVLTNLLTIGIMISAGTYFFTEALRLCYFYCIFSIISLPNAIANISSVARDDKELELSGYKKYFYNIIAKVKFVVEKYKLNLPFKIIINFYNKIPVDKKKLIYTYTFLIIFVVYFFMFGMQNNGIYPYEFFWSN